MNIDYELRLLNTAAATGYFGCIPAGEPDLEEGLEALKKRPFDDFLRQYLLARTLSLEPEARQSFFKALSSIECDDIVASFISESCVAAGEPLPEELQGRSDEYQAATSLIHMRSVRQADQKLHYQWIRLFKENLRNHLPLPAPDSAGLEWPVEEKPGAGHAPGHTPRHTIDALPGVGALYQRARTGRISKDGWEPAQTASNAFEKLRTMDVLEGPENRHVASLSPIAFLRKWCLKRIVRSGRNQYSLAGIQTSYGKGLSPDAARASCLMEIVERVSSFVSIEKDRFPDTLQDHRLAYGSYQDLYQRGWPALDPNRLALEIPYQDEPLYWIQGRDRLGGITWVPAQAVFLFSNLDEVSLFSSLGSTGLASGNSLDNAKTSALLEVLERDADSVVPFDPRSCFILDSDNPHLAPLFAAYRSSGIAVLFQDITTEFTVPCYRAFVVTSDGLVIRGTGAHLDARKAVISALTEIAYPFPSATPTMGHPKTSAHLKFESLANYDTGNCSTNLAILEALLTDRGYEPVYVDLTRKDLGIPVIRAIVPGLEVMADFDRFSRVSPRLFANYVKGCGVGF